MLKSGLLFAAALVMAPLANAQGSVTCNDISGTLEAAAWDFEDYVGEELDEYVYASELTLPGANACTLQLDFDAVLFCLWNHSSEASARAAYDQLSATVSACLAGWSPASVLDEAPLPASALLYNLRSGAGDFEGMEVMVHMDRFEEGGEATYEVWYELAYYLL